MVKNRKINPSKRRTDSRAASYVTFNDERGDNSEIAEVARSRPTRSGSTKRSLTERSVNSNTKVPKTSSRASANVEESVQIHSNQANVNASATTSRTDYVQRSKSTISNSKSAGRRDA